AVSPPCRDGAEQPPTTCHRRCRRHAFHPDLPSPLRAGRPTGSPQHRRLGPAQLWTIWVAGRLRGRDGGPLGAAPPVNRYRRARFLVRVLRGTEPGQRRADGGERGIGVVLRTYSAQAAMASILASRATELRRRRRGRAGEGWTSVRR